MRWLEKGNDVDKILRGGISIMLILLLLFFAAMIWMPFGMSSKKMMGMPIGMVILVLSYGLANIGVLCGVYFMAAKNINSTLYRLSSLIEDLIDGKERTAFPAAEDTILSKLQGQLLKLYDILRSYEEREQGMRKQLDENIGNLVHQMNTPITNIRLYAGFLNRDDLMPEERVRFIGHIEEQAAKLSWLGEGFSKISRMETGVIRQKPEWQEVLPVILCAVDQVMEKAGQKEMDIKLMGERHAFAMIDGKWTAEAVFNVLDNAVKYGDRGSSIEIEVTELTGYVRVSVRNYGIRIEKGEYHKVFKRFYRGMRAAGEEGVGLGLTIVREVLEGEKGYAKVETLWDGRTEFSLHFVRSSKGSKGEI